MRCTIRSRRCSTPDRGGRGRIGPAAPICSASDRLPERELHTAADRRARRPARRPRHAGQPARSARPGAGADADAAAWPEARPAAGRGVTGGAGGVRDAVAAPVQRHGRLHRGRQGIRGRPRRQSRDAAAVGERDREPDVRHDRVGVRFGVHVGRKQPRESPHALLERSGQRPDRRSACSSATTRRETRGRPRQGRCAGRPRAADA